MAASTLRFAIIVALVVGGIVVINQAFPDVSGETATIPDVGVPTESASPSPSPTPSETPTQAPSPTVAGTVIVVVNAAGQDGLAGDTTTLLVEQYNYEALEPGTAPSLSPNTTIYYVKRRDKVEADFLENDFFAGVADTVRVARLPADLEVDPAAQLVIYIGQDYAAVA